MGEKGACLQECPFCKIGQNKYKIHSIAMTAHVSSWSMPSLKMVFIAFLGNQVKGLPLGHISG